MGWVKTDIEVCDDPPGGSVDHPPQGIRLCVPTGQIDFLRPNHRPPRSHQLHLMRAGLQLEQPRREADALPIDFDFTALRAFAARGNPAVTDLGRIVAGPPRVWRPDTPRAVTDYIAGMTDRFADREHQRLTGRKLIASA